MIEMMILSVRTEVRELKEDSWCVARAAKISRLASSRVGSGKNEISTGE